MTAAALEVLPDTGFRYCVDDGDAAYVGIARRGSGSRTGFRALKAQESDALSSKTAAPYRAPQHRNSASHRGFWQSQTFRFPLSHATRGERTCARCASLQSS